MSLADEMYVANFVKHEEQDITDAERWEKEKTTMASNYLQLFSSKAGKAVLKDMISTYLTAPFAHANSTQVEVGIREGEAKSVRRIINLMDYAKGVKNGN